MFLPHTDIPAIIPQRIVSVVPSQTELLHYLGLEQQTVGITRFCVHPREWFNSKTRVGGTKTLHLDQIKKLQPDLIIANAEENTKEQIESLAEDHTVLLTDVQDIPQALQMIRTIGWVTGKGPEADALANAISTAFLQVPQPPITVPTAYLIWNDPYMTVGGDTFINAMLAAAGMQNVFVHHKRYPEVTIENIKASGCRLLLLSSEPYPFKQKHIDELQQHLPHTKIMLADGELFSWYGSRMLKAAAYFKQLLLTIHH